jgi:hypothetical protein
MLTKYFIQHTSLNVTPTYLPAYEDGTDSVPKRRHIKFRRQGTIQKKAYNIQNTAKVLNQQRDLFKKKFNAINRVEVSSEPLLNFQNIL